ncbi:MAG: manganese efflux pump [Oscillospiraceae bacterium]|nr:manganese efflux pump [Oscillospiraceae bacterium]
MLRIVEILILVFALSIDALVASFAYGSQKIKIPVRSVLTLSLICSGILALALYLGTQAAMYIDERLIGGISFAILFGLGLMRICDSSLKNWIRRRENHTSQINFSAFNLKFVLQVYADPNMADVDASRILSPREALALAVALSLDSIAAGLGAGLLGAGIPLAAGLMAILTAVAVVAGCALGGKLAHRLTADISWLSGVLLIILAVLQL